MHIQLLRADVTSLKIDAVASPTVASLAQGARAVVVSGGNLLARFVIEVPVPHGDSPDADARLRDATTAVLARADELAVASLGLPVLGKRADGYESERCARIMLSAARDYRARARSLQKAVFCLFGKEEYAVFEAVLKELDS
jgi:O-acetyl-ADP-ribose deacetylase (regulator of RNase III)